MLDMIDIPSFEGRYAATRDGKIYSHLTNKFLSPNKTGSSRSYFSVSLGRRKTSLVHTLVLLTYRGPRPLGYVARHLDGNSLNNFADNLVWSTQSENCLDKNSHGTMIAGEKHHKARIDDATVALLLDARKTGLSFPVLGRKFGISTSQAHRICSGQNRVNKCG